MCGIKCFISLCLAILATTVSAQNDTSQICTQNPLMEARALNVSKCYVDSITAALSKDTEGLICKSFNDFNATYTMFFKDVMKTCFNVTNAEFTESQETFLDMVNAVQNYNKLNATHCLVDIMPKIRECGNQNLTERNYTETWLRRSRVDFTDYSCDKISDNMNCTINVVKENCKSEHNAEVTAMISSLYQIPLKHCNTTTDSTRTGSSSNFSPFSHLILILTAFALIVKS